MSGSSDPGLLRRLVGYDLTLERESSEIVEEFDWGLLIHNPETPDVWSGNYLQIRSTDLEADTLAALADEIQGPLEGIKHRDVVPADPDHGDRLAPGFEALEGWDVVRSVYMVLSRKPTREGGSAREVERTSVAAIRRAVAEDDPDFTKEAAEQRLIRDARLDSVGKGRWFAAPVDGEPDSACVLYDHDGVGQVETVVTRPEARNRGLATAVVTAAIEASQRAGHELTFIVADAEEWPWKLYEQLGFDRVGVLCSFVRKPPQLRGGSP